MRFPIPSVLTAVVALLVAVPSLAPAQGSCDGESHRALDFLLGDWRVLDGQGAEVGRSAIRSVAGGCGLVEEHSESSGRSVQGLLIHDPSSGAWHGSWVGSDGGLLRVTGEAEGDRAVLVGDAASAMGSARGRLTLERQGDAVAQTVELSTDGGASWIPLSTSRYVPAAAETAPPSRPAAPTAPTARATTPETAPEPRSADPRSPEARSPEARSPETRSPETVPRAAPEPAAPRDRPDIERSARVEDRPAPAPSSVEVLSAEDTGHSSDPIRMASPMQLQLPLGPIDKLPDGYGWSSTDTARYRAAGVAIQRVEVERRRRGGQVEIAATLGVHAEAFVQRADIGVELLGPDGEVLASASLPRVSTGRGIPEQSEKGAVFVTARMSVEREVFERIFGGSERPQLRLTVTADE